MDRLMAMLGFLSVFGLMSYVSFSGLFRPPQGSEKWIKGELVATMKKVGLNAVIFAVTLAYLIFVID